jgi:hypothetical protein
MAVDLEGERLFVVALGNNTLKVIDLRAGKHIRRITGLSEPEGVLYVPEPQSAPLWLILGHLQPFLSPDSFHSLMVHHPAVTSQQRQDAAITVSSIPGRIANDGSSQPNLVIRLGGSVTLGRTRLANHPADTPSRHRQSLPDMLDALPATGRA